MENFSALVLCSARNIRNKNSAYRILDSPLTPFSHFMTPLPFLQIFTCKLHVLFCRIRSHHIIWMCFWRTPMRVVRPNTNTQLTHIGMMLDMCKVQFETKRGFFCEITFHVNDIICVFYFHRNRNIGAHSLWVFALNWAPWKFTKQRDPKHMFHINKTFIIYEFIRTCWLGKVYIRTIHIYFFLSFPTRQKDKYTQFAWSEQTERINWTRIIARKK